MIVVVSVLVVAGRQDDITEKPPVGYVVAFPS